MYQINHKLKVSEQIQFIEVQKEYESNDFCADNISRCSEDSSIFLPQISQAKAVSSGKLNKPKRNIHASDHTIGKSRVQRFGGV